MEKIMRNEVTLESGEVVERNNLRVISVRSVVRKEDADGIISDLYQRLGGEGVTLADLEATNDNLDSVDWEMFLELVG
jgi:hypothetical protein